MADLAANPRSRLVTIRDALTPREWVRVSAMAGTVIGLNVLGWGLTAAAAGRYHISPKELFGFGTGILAYTLGLRHAFDADHIAAIDNTTRKLVNDGKRPLSVGFFFSLGHSTIVFLLALLLNFGIRRLNQAVKNGNSSLHTVTGIVGTSVSGTFLFIIAGMNLVILLGIIKVFREMRAGRYDDQQLEEQLDKRGLMNRFFGPLARRVDAPWKIYPVGVLFGLGFDTASEVALLLLAGTAVVGGLPFWAVMSLPILFAAGMSLLDTIDGCFMNFAYDWAFARPIRKVYYNMTITGLSVFVAAFVGTIEILSLIGQEAHFSGGFWDFMANFNLNAAGFVIVGVFVATWAVALSIWRFGNIEQKWDLAAAQATMPDAGRPATSSDPLRQAEAVDLLRVDPDKGLAESWSEARAAGRDRLGPAADLEHARSPRVS
jgi:nickel/cobalt transporter (NiCoT) family protein